MINRSQRKEKTHGVLRKIHKKGSNGLYMTFTCSIRDIIYDSPSQKDRTGYFQFNATYNTAKYVIKTGTF